MIEYDAEELTYNHGWYKYSVMVKSTKKYNSVDEECYDALKAIRKLLLIQMKYFKGR